MEKAVKSKASKIVVIVLSVVLGAVFIGSAVFAVIGAFRTFTPTLVELKDIKIPSKVNDDLWGLVFFEKNANEEIIYKHSDKDFNNVNFDVNKPTVIFIHGMQYQVGYHDNELFANPEGWLDAGYNVGEFLWSQFSDDGAPQGRNKVWGANNGMSYCSTDASGKRKVIDDDNDRLNYSIAECFVAYYMDFMQKIDYKGSFIQFEGLSLGSNTLFAVCNYMLTLEKYDLLDAKYLPDRTTFHDAYLDNTSDDVTFVNWLNGPIGVDGSAGLAAKTAVMLRERGIASEYIGSSGVGRTTSTELGKGSKLSFDIIIDNMVFLQYQNQWTSNPSEQHISGKNWYNGLIDYPVMADNTNTDAQSYGISPYMPISFLYAREGAKYTMDKNYTKDNIEDDVLYSNVTKPKIAGFAFLDANNNGFNDDRLYNRVDSVKVELLDKNGTVVKTAVTAKGGYYEFELASSDIGGKFFIKVDLSGSGYTIGTMANRLVDMNNDIYSSTSKSGEISIGYANDLFVTNIGLRK